MEDFHTRLAKLKGSLGLQGSAAAVPSPVSGVRSASGFSSTGSALTATPRPVAAANDEQLVREFLSPAGIEAAIHSKVVSSILATDLVSSNWHYRAVASRTRLIFLWEGQGMVGENDPAVVNAFASWPAAATEPTIIMLSGLICAHRALAAAVTPLLARRAAPAEMGQALRRILPDLARRLAATQGRFSGDDLSSWLNDTPAYKAVVLNNGLCSQANSVALAMHAEVIAHELGHLALGHSCIQGGRRHVVSRNQEREADSFAASVAAGQLFAQHFVMGGILSNLMFVWMHQVAEGVASLSTHPAPEERVRDYVHSNAEDAALLGITHETLRHFLPAR